MAFILKSLSVSYCIPHCYALSLTCLLVFTAEEDLFRDCEAHTQHIFVGCYIAHKMHRAPLLQGEPKAAGSPLHHVLVRAVLFREPVAVHCG